jgi:transposase
MEKELEKINTNPKTLEEAIQVIGQLVKVIVDLKKENDSLRERLNNHSNNSSLPPSRDIKKKKKEKKKSGRKQGAQPGHKASQRPMVSADKVDTIVDCKPKKQCDCGGIIVLNDKTHIHQVFDIPLAKYEVTEYRIYRGSCNNCHQHHKGQLPAGVSTKGFGARTQALLSLLTSKYRLSKRLAKSLFSDVYQMPICVGSVSNIERGVSESLQAAHTEVGQALKTESVIHVDETGYKERNKSGWAWLVSAMKYSYFLLNKSRGKKIARELIGDYHGRIVVTDRYASYNFLPDKNHQICWAHLKRDFQKIYERPDKASSRIGKKLLESYEQLFGFWKTEYREELGFSKKQKKRLRYFKAKMLRWLIAGTHCGHEKTSRTCGNILDVQDSLWHFFNSKDIPATNNHAERQIRPLVISKKLSFGTQSDRGSRFIERVFTVITSCQQQGRDTLGFIIQSLQHHMLGIQAPSLLAVSTS